MRIERPVKTSRRKQNYAYFVYSWELPQSGNILVDLGKEKGKFSLSKHFPMN
jgi:hypothetical protein